MTISNVMARYPREIHVNKDGNPINQEQARLAKIAEKTDFWGEMSKAIYADNVRPPETAVIGEPGTLNRKLNSEEKDYIRKNFDLEHMTQKEGDQLTSYLEERGVLSPREYIPPEQTTVEYAAKTYGKDYMCVMYGFDPGVRSIYFQPMPDDGYYTALRKQVELNHLKEKGIAQDKIIIPPVKREYAYQEELLKSLTAIYKEMGAGSSIANAESVIQECYDMGKEDYIRALKETSRMGMANVSGLGGAVPAINELVSQSLKTISVQWEDSKSRTLDEWMESLFDRRDGKEA